MKAKIFIDWINKVDPNTEIVFAVDNYSNPEIYLDLNTIDAFPVGKEHKTPAVVFSLGRPWPRPS